MEGEAGRQITYVDTHTHTYMRGRHRGAHRTGTADVSGRHLGEWAGWLID
jgi:hypothetical protein